MGQKVHPSGLRVGVIHDWKSNWFAGSKDFSDWLIEDVQIRDHIYGKLAHAGLSDILIRKDKQRVTVDIYTARPGIVIGKSGVEVDALRRELHAITHKNVHININEIKRPELDAKLVAQSVAEQLQNRVSFRRAMKRALASAIRSGAHGIKIVCSGRLGGAEMSRSEGYSEGRVPLHTIRADIDYGFTEARTTFGRIGVKVWINKGEIMPEGYEGLQGGRESRLGEQDQARRRGLGGEGLAGGREGGRGRGIDREGLGPVRQRRRGPRGQGQRPPRQRQEGGRPPEARLLPSAEAPEVAIEAAAIETVTPAPEAAPAVTPETVAGKPKPAAKPKAAAEGPKPADKKPAAEKPKRAPRSRAAAKPTAEKAAAAAEPDKPKRAARTKPAAKADPAAKKPAPAKMAPAEKAAAGKAAAEKPAAKKPAARTKAKAEPSAGEEKPKRSPRKKAEPGSEGSE
jgi:small subunit ribosomal protein S3